MAGSPPSVRQLVGLGAVIAGSVILGLVVGFVLDSLWHTSPRFVLVGLVIGVFGAVASATLQIRRSGVLSSPTAADQQEVRL